MDLARNLRRRQRLFLAAIVSLIALGLPSLWFVMTYRTRQTVGRIKALNGLVDSTASIRLPIGAIRYGELDRVYLNGPLTDDDELRVLRGVPALQILTLTNTRVTDDGLAELTRFPNLMALYIGNVDQVKLIGAAGNGLNTKPLVTGKGLERLKDLPKLQVVQIIGSPTTDEDLQSLKHLKQLIFVDLKETKVTPAGVAELKKALPNCRVTLR